MSAFLLHSSTFVPGEKAKEWHSVVVTSRVLHLCSSKSNFSTAGKDRRKMSRGVTKEDNERRIGKRILSIQCHYQCKIYIYFSVLISFKAWLIFVALNLDFHTGLTHLCDQIILLDLDIEGLNCVHTKMQVDISWIIMSLFILLINIYGIPIMHYAEILHNWK